MTRPAGAVVGDSGDNLGVWPSVSVDQVGEPASLHDATAPARRLRFRYAHGRGTQRR
jgi:hypothetical protein